jgi:hypothetical protein
MMDRSGDLVQRLESWIRPTTLDRQAFYEIIQSPDVVLVQERAQPGEAVVPCPLPEQCICIQWRLDTGLFRFLQGEKNADGPLLLGYPDGRYEAHIIECKATVGHRNWSEIVEQMRWTLLKLLAIAGVLGIRIDRVVFGTAYRNDKLSRHENPVATKPTISTRDDQTPKERERREIQSGQIAWERGELRLPGFVHPFRHVRIELDSMTGHALSPYRF